MANKILRYKFIIAGFSLSFILTLAGFLRAYFSLKNIDQPLIIHFNNLVGINQVGGLRDILNIGVLATTVILINCLLAFKLEAGDRFFGKILMAATLFLGFLIFLYFSIIVRVN